MFHHRREPSFGVDVQPHRPGGREHWIPTTDDGGDLRSRASTEPDDLVDEVRIGAVAEE